MYEKNIKEFLQVIKILHYFRLVVSLSYLLYINIFMKWNIFRYCLDKFMNIKDILILRNLRKR